MTQDLEIQNMDLNNWQLRYQNANIIGKRLNSRYKRKWLWYLKMAIVWGIENEKCQDDKTWIYVKFWMALLSENKLKLS